MFRVHGELHIRGEVLRAVGAGDRKQVRHELLFRVEVDPLDFSWFLEAEHILRDKDFREQPPDGADDTTSFSETYIKPTVVLRLGPVRPKLRVRLTRRAGYVYVRLKRRWKITIVFARVKTARSPVFSLQINTG
jgi:hypothetical protein